MAEEEIVISGTGIICAIGKNPEEVTLALRAGKYGLRKLDRLQGREVEPVYAGAVPNSDSTLHSMLLDQDRTGGGRTFLLGMYAARQAISHLADEDRRILRGGIIAGGTVGGMDITEHHFNDLAHPTETIASKLREHDLGSATSMIARNLGIDNFETTISTACSSSANAIILGSRLLKQNQLDYVLVGGMDALTAFTIRGFQSLMIYDRQLCRPFDQSREGLNLGEGAAFLLLRRKSDLDATRQYISISGYANTNDAFHQTASSEEGNGAYQSMRQALDSAAIAASAIGYVNAHGTGTENNDSSEIAALDRIFAAVDRPVLYGSTKSFTGHTLAAAGGIEAVICALCMKYGFVPGNLNLHQPIESAIMSPVMTAVVGDVNHILSNSFGFGGNCSSILFSRSINHG